MSALTPSSQSIGRRRSFLQEEDPHYAETNDAPSSIFAGVRCGEFIKDQNVVVIENDVSLKKAIEILSSHNISSAPVVDKEGKYIRIVDFKDLANEVLKIVKEAQKVKLLTDMNAQLESMIDHIRVGIIPYTGNTDWTSKDRPFYYVNERDDLYTAVKLFLSKRIHRLCIMNQDTGRVKGMLSQSDIIRFITARLNDPKLAAVGAKTLHQLGLDVKREGTTDTGKALGLVTLTQTKSVMEALSLMYRKQCSSLCLVDDKGLLVGTLSFSHIQETFKQRLYSTFTTSCADFVKQTQSARSQEHKDATSDTVTPDSTLADTMFIVTALHLHRVFVVVDKIPVSVVSLTDILAQFASV